MSLIFTEIATFVRTKETVSTAVSYLNKWGCCARCTLRFIGTKDADVFRTNDIDSLTAWLVTASAAENSDDASKKIAVDCSDINGVVDQLELAGSAVSDPGSRKMDAEVATDKKSETRVSTDKEAVCTACLGILQERYCCKAFTDEIARAVCEQQFEYHSFLCSVSIPVSIMLREYSVLLALSHVMPSIFDDIQRDTITPVKDVWKWVNGPRLASALKSPFDQKSPFEIVVSFTYTQNDNECRFLYGLQPSIFKKRKKNQQQSQNVDVFNRTNVSHALNESSREAFRCAYKCPPTRPSAEVTIIPVVCQHAALYLAGRYVHMQFSNKIFIFYVIICHFVCYMVVLISK